WWRVRWLTATTGAGSYSSARPSNAWPRRRWRRARSRAGRASRSSWRRCSSLAWGAPSVSRPTRPPSPAWVRPPRFPAPPPAPLAAPAPRGVLYAFGPPLPSPPRSALSPASTILLAFAPNEHLTPKRVPTTPSPFFPGAPYIRHNPILLGIISLDLFAVLLGG